MQSLVFVSLPFRLVDSFQLLFAVGCRLFVKFAFAGCAIAGLVSLPFRLVDFVSYFSPLVAGCFVTLVAGFKAGLVFLQVTLLVVASWLLFHFEALFI